MDKVIIFIVIGVILAGIGFWAIQTSLFTGGNITPTPVVDGIVLFYGADCPHCKIVDDFVKENNIAEKVKFTNLEVPFGYKTSPTLLSNADLLLEKAKICKIDVSEGVSIPFLYDGKGNCVIGGQPVIEFFKKEVELSQKYEKSK